VTAAAGSAPRAGVLAAGVGFTEGPLWTLDSRLLVVVTSRGVVAQIDLGGAGVVSTVETGGGPNGLAETSDGTVWVAQNGAVRPSRSPRRVIPGLQRILGSEVTDVAVPHAMAPNDLAVGPDGRIWFTDPGPGLAGPGRLCAHDPATGRTTVLIDGSGYPNGLAFDGDLLYLAWTDAGHVTRHHWTGGGLEAAGDPLALPAGGPDGLALDTDGRLYAAAPDADAVVVFEPDGRPGRTLRFDGPTFPTNLCFAGPDLDVLVVTAAKGGRVLVVDDLGGARGRPQGRGRGDAEAYAEITRSRPDRATGSRLRGPGIPR
jgi:gluconolactonase